MDSFISKPKIFLAIFFIFLGIFAFFEVWAQEAKVSFSMDENGYLDSPVYGKLTITLYHEDQNAPLPSCTPRIDFGDREETLTPCSFPSDSPETYFKCEYEFRHIYPGPVSRYPTRTGSITIGSLAECGYYPPQPLSGRLREFVLCPVFVRFDCNNTSAEEQSALVFLQPAGPSNPTLPQPPTSPIQATTLEELIGKIANVAFWFFFSLLIIFIPFGGLLILSSAGNPRQIKKGQNTIFYALLGAGIIALARGLVELFLIVFQIRR